jgi:hypothetical protein
MKAPSDQTFPFVSTRFAVPGTRAEAGDDARK